MTLALGDVCLLVLRLTMGGLATVISGPVTFLEFCTPVVLRITEFFLAGFLT